MSKRDVEQCRQGRRRKQAPARSAVREFTQSYSRTHINGHKIRVLLDGTYPLVDTLATTHLSAVLQESGSARAEWGTCDGI